MTAFNSLARCAAMAALAVVVGVALVACSERPDGTAKAGTTQAAGDDGDRAPAVPVDLAEVTLSVPGMTCLMCPITVRKALKGVDGVHEAEATLSDKSAVVWFDPDQTDTGQLIDAVAGSGFEATVKESVDE